MSRLARVFTIRVAINSALAGLEREYRVGFLKEIQAYVDMKLAQEKAWNDRDNIENKRF